MLRLDRSQLYGWVVDKLGLDRAQWCTLALEVFCLHTSIIMREVLDG